VPSQKSKEVRAEFAAICAAKSQINQGEQALLIRPTRSRIRALEATAGIASVSLALTLGCIWLTTPPAAEPAYSLIAVGAFIATVLVLAVFAYILHQRPAEIHRQRLAEAQVKYKTRAELNEARYMEKSDLLEITLGHVNQGIAFVNAEGKLLIFNKRAVEYAGMDEMQFASPEFAFPIDVRVIFTEQWKKGEFGPNGELLPEDVRQYFLTGKGTLPKSYVRRRPNGTVLEVRTEFLPSGGMVQSYTDLTELVTAKEAAEAGARTKSAFLATMSHEIRTPLNGVLGMAALLRRSGLSSEQMECVETIRSCGDALLSIIDDILSFSKLETGMVEIEQVPFGLARLVNSAVRVSLGPAQAKNLELTFELAPDLPPFARGDEKRIRQVLLNLLSNAVKFTPHGSVRLRVRASEGGSEPRLRFEVTDTGIGIPDSAKDRLFKEFSQGDASINRRFGGTGLGLAISKRLIEAMGGAIGLISTPGTGSSFWFEIPLHVAEAPAEAEQAADVQDPERGLRILVVEDMAVNQKVAKGMLRSLGHLVDIAEDGEAALAKFKSRPYDLIFMDMQMPRMNGLEATAAIRALESGKSVPIIAMTANVFATDRDTCLAGGMDDFVGKPINVPDLAAAIARVSANGPQRAQALQSGLPTIEFNQTQFEALAEHIGADELGSIIDSFLEQASRLLEQVERAADRQQSDERARLLESLREAAAVLGFSQGAYECQEAARSLPNTAAALARIRGSLQLNVARSQVLLSMRAGNARAAA
jgi:signal transduction histidine kinase/DNA-binding response OmpR family regulator